MPNPMKLNWKVVAGLLLMGALPALPAGFLVSLIFAGEPHAFLKPIYLERPVPIELHAVAGIIFWLLMPLQFSPRLRQKYPRWHRLSGRMAVAAAVLLGASALWLVAFNPAIGGVLRSANLVVTGAGAMAAFAYALWLARRRKMAQHRAWMMRAVAIIYGPASLAIIAIPVYMFFGEFPAWLSEIDRWLGLFVNLAFVEWLLRRKGRALRVVAVRA